MEWVRDFVVKTFLLNERDHREESPCASPTTQAKPRKRSLSHKKEEELLPSLNGRATPADLVRKASFRIKHIPDAQYTLHTNGEFLIVNLPKRRGVRKDYVMPYYSDMKALCEQIGQDMAYDGFDSMTSFQLAAEYPFYFWNGMFHCLGRLEVLEQKMRKNGIQTKTKRRK